MLNARKIVIIGGVAGGATAATRLRRLDETSHIVLFERGAYVSFANCGLPYTIGNVVAERDHLFVQTAEGLSQRFNLDIRTLSEVTAINRNKRTVTVRQVESGHSYEESYDTLILSPGAQPLLPPLQGLREAERVFTLRSIPDMDRIMQFLEREQPRRAIVIGGGFVGLEMAENLVRHGLQVTLVEKHTQVLTPLDAEMVTPVQQHLVEKGVELILGDGALAFAQQGRRVMLQSGTVLEADMVVLAVGVRPEQALAKQEGLAIGKTGGILVDQFLRTSDKHIYAIGDAIEVKHAISGERGLIPLAGPANRQGRMVADIIYGRRKPYAGTLGTAIVKVFELTVAMTGVSEKTLLRLGWPYAVVHINAASHPGYYPGSHPIALKLLFHPRTGVIYGAQAVGQDGVDKRMDVLATAIRGELTVFALSDLELSYAPPYSSAKDPVNMLGYVAANVVEGAVNTIQYYEIDAAVARGGLLLDVREPQEFARGHIAGAINIPLSELRQRLAELPRDLVIYVNCQSGLRSYLATRILAGHGLRAINLDGGYKTYIDGQSHVAKQAIRPPLEETLLLKQS